MSEVSPDSLLTRSVPDSPSRPSTRPMRQRRIAWSMSDSVSAASGDQRATAVQNARAISTRSASSRAACACVPASPVSQASSARSTAMWRSELYPSGVMLSAHTNG